MGLSRVLVYTDPNCFDSIMFMRQLICLLFLVLGAGPLAAQEPRSSHCIAIADAAPGINFIHRASWSAPLARFSVRIHYISHSSFLIRTHSGLNVVTGLYRLHRFECHDSGRGDHEPRA